MAPARHAARVWDFSLCLRCNSSAAALFRSHGKAFAIRPADARPSLIRMYANEAQVIPTATSGMRDHLRQWKAQQQQQQQPDPSTPLVDGQFTLNPKGNVLAEEIHREQEYDEIMLADRPSFREPVTSSEDARDSLEWFEPPTLDAEGIKSLMKYRSPDAVCNPGDLFRFLRPTPYLGVFVGMTDDMEYIIIDAQGQMTLTRRSTSDFHYPGFLSQADLAAIRPYLADAAQHQRSFYAFYPDIPRNLIQPVVNSILSLQDKAARIQRALGSSLTTAHEILAHPTNTLYMTISKVCRAIVSHSNSDVDPNDLQTRFAVIDHLFEHSAGFLPMADYTEASESAVTVLSAQFMKSYRYVSEAVDAYKEVSSLRAGGYRVPKRLTQAADRITQFAHKCRRIMLDIPNRTRVAPNGTLLVLPGSDSAEVVEPVVGGVDRAIEVGAMTKHMFTDEDRHFIRLLMLAASDRVFMRQRSMQTLAVDLIRAMEMRDLYGDQVDRLTYHNLLVHIGVISHYSQPFIIDWGIWPLSDEMMHQVREEIPARLDAGQSLYEIANLEDSMYHLRKDWGDMIAFALDSDNTDTTDAAISLEPVEGEPDRYWVHIHVSHFSAFVSPDSVLGRVAAHYPMSAYFRGTRLAMLPPWATSPFSIGLNGRVLTFSAKVDSTGEILDVNVQPGIIRNVFRAYPGWVDHRIFGQEREPQKSTDHRSFHFRVGSQGDFGDSASLQTDYTGFTEEHRGVIFSMEQLSRNLFKDIPLTSVEPEKSKLYVSGYDFSTLSAVRNSAPSTPEPFTMDPIIKYETRESFGDPLKISSETPSQRIVRRFSLMSSVIAALWATKRNIPVVYTGSGRWAGDDEGSAARLIRSLENGSVFGVEQSLRRHIRNLRSRRQSTSPIAHQYLNIPGGLVSASTPLRSYTDLMTHWQFDAALQEEARTGQIFDGSKSSHVLPFQTSDVQEYIGVSNGVKTNLSAAVNYENRMWILQLIARGFYFNDFELPDPLLCVVTLVDGLTVHGRLVAFEIAGSFARNQIPADIEFKLGEVWEVKIFDIEPFCTKSITWVPVKRARTAEGVWLDEIVERMKKPEEAETAPPRLTGEKSGKGYFKPWRDVLSGNVV